MREEEDVICAYPTTTIYHDNEEDANKNGKDDDDDEEEDKEGIKARKTAKATADKQENGNRRRISKQQVTHGRTWTATAIDYSIMFPFLDSL